MKKALEAHPRNSGVIHVLDDRFDGYTAGGAWQDAVLGLAHPRSFDRIAVVSDAEQHPPTRDGRGLVHPRRGEALPERELEQATAWAIEGLEAP